VAEELGNAWQANVPGAHKHIELLLMSHQGLLHDRALQLCFLLLEHLLFLFPPLNV
jgi:hypothetical protein